MADRTRPRSPSRNKGRCSIDGCDSPVQCRGWCNRHYLRWRKHGDPLMVAQPARVPPEVRFWQYVDKSSNPDGCWLWTGACNPVTQYGTIHIRSDAETRMPVNAYVHRFVYEMEVGPIPDDMTIDHLCRVRKCVNPEHLEVVTREENSRRGSLAYWSAHPRGLARPRKPRDPAAATLANDPQMSDTTTRVLFAIMQQDAPTTRSIGSAVGASPSTVLAHMRRLRSEGLIGYESGRHGTLRPTVEIVAVFD